jgi:FtsH-binding integral membrane protein
VAEATVDIRNQFIRKVYTILTVQLIATAAVSSISFFNEGYKNWIQSHVALVWVSVCGPPQSRSSAAVLSAHLC